MFIFARSENDFIFIFAVCKRFQSWHLFQESREVSKYFNHRKRNTDSN